MPSHLHNSSSPGTSHSSKRHVPIITKILLVILVLGLSFFAPRAAHAVSSSTCTPVADFDVSPDPLSLTLLAGTTGVSTVTITPIDGFSQPINLKTANVPADLTVTLSVTSVSIGAGPVVFTATVKASSAIASGVYSFDVNATTTTTLFHDRTITVHVPQPELGLTPDKEFVSINQGSSNTVTISLESLYGLPSATVALTKKVSTLIPTPTDPDVTLSPTPVMLSPGGTATSTLTISTSAMAPVTTPGEYSIQVNGTASPGSVTNATTIAVIVESPTFILFADPSFLTIPAGSTDHSTINATSVGGFTGTVTLTAFQLVPDVSITTSLSLMSVTVPAGSFANSVLTIVVGASATSGSHTILVTGKSGTMTGLPAYVAIIVPGPPKPGYSMTGSPDPVTIAQTGSATSMITLTSLNGFVDTVGLSIECFPDGLTADITPASVPLTSSGTGSATLTVSASTFTVPGNFTVDVFGLGTSTFVPNDTSIKVTVTGPDFSLTATPLIVYMTTGATATSTITATSKLGFSGLIKLETSILSLTGTGLTASLSKTTLNPSGSSDSATLTLTATATGSYGIEIKGSSWPLVHTAGEAVLVTAPTPDFSVLASPATLTIVQGTSQTSTISLSLLNGFTDTVSLSATSSTGITPTPSLASISGTETSTLTISVASAVTTGPHTVDVAGTSGTLVHHATITVTVTAVAPTPDFTISATTPVSFTSGTTATSTVNVAATNGFYAYVTLTASAPNGLTVALSSSYVYPGTFTATFSSSTPGSYTVTITGTSGMLVHSATVQVTVTTVGTPDFTINSNPSTLTIQAGNSGASTITITQSHNFAGTVALTGTVSPPGPTISFSTSSITISSGSTLTINVPNTVGAGTYTVTVQGTSGSLAHSTQVTITVTSAPSTQPAAPAPTIVGLSPLVFYGLIGVLIAAVIGGVAVVIRRKNP